MANIWTFEFHGGKTIDKDKILYIDIIMCIICMCKHNLKIKFDKS